MTFSICIPTLNAGNSWLEFSAALRSQTVHPDVVLVIDSASTDGTAERAEADGFQVLRIARKDFRHGATRQIAVERTASDILVFLTQDARLASADAIERLIEAFRDPSVGAAYGRQLPRPHAGPSEAHARLFNYPAVPHCSSQADIARRGFKTIFISNSFAAYRVSMLRAAGGFPRDVNFGEDTVTAARMILNGLKIAYVAEAAVFHSHDYGWREEYRRYREIGELHSQHSWMLDKFGGASGEGLRFLRSQLAFLAVRAPHLIPSALIATFCKYLGYRVGRRRAFALASAPIPPDSTSPEGDTRGKLPVRH